jgi:hypothetical protein
MIELERVPDQQACIEIRAVDPMLSESARQDPAHGFDSDANQRWPCGGGAGVAQARRRHEEAPSAAKSSA